MCIGSEVHVFTTDYIRCLRSEGISFMLPLSFSSFLCTFDSDASNLRFLRTSNPDSKSMDQSLYLSSDLSSPGSCQGIVLFHFPPIHFPFSCPFLIHLSSVLLVLPLTLLSARSSLLSLSPSFLFSPLFSHPSSLCSGPILVGVCARRCHFTYSSSTRTSPSSSHLPTMCSTTWPLLPLSTSFPNLPVPADCWFRSSLLSLGCPSSFPRDSSLSLPIGYSDTSVLSNLHTWSLLIANLSHVTMFPLANRFPSSSFSRLRSDWVPEFLVLPQSSIYSVPSGIYLP